MLVKSWACANHLCSAHSEASAADRATQLVKQRPDVRVFLLQAALVITSCRAVLFACFW